MILNFLFSGLIVVGLNCENLFDCQHDSLKNDYDFLPTSEKCWTPNRYWKKLNNISRSILSCSTVFVSDSLENEQLPDIVGLTEVENDSVMFDLTHRSLLRNAGYEYVMTESDDERGIDVALVYQPTAFKLLEQKSLKVPRTDEERPTRDILFARGLIKMADAVDTLNVFVVHFPSRRNGERQTRDYRLRAAKCIVDEIGDKDANVIVLGDFNDYDNDASVKFLEDNGLFNIKPKSRYHNEITGTYKYRDQWGSLDHIMVSGNLAKGVGNCFINDSDFLLQGENEKLMPRRTYRGNFYQEGYSDHLPITAIFYTSH